MPVSKITKIATLTGHTGSIYSLISDPEGPQIFYSGSGDGNVIKWDLNNLSQALRIAKVPSNIFSMMLLPQQNKLLVGQMLGGIHVLDLKEKKEERYLAYHRKGVFDLRENVHNSQLLAAGGDGILSVWNQDFSLANAIQVSQKSLRQMVFHPTLSMLAVGCSDNTVCILNSGSYKFLHRLHEHLSSVFSVCFSPDGKYLLTGSRDAHLRIWTVQDFHLQQEIAAHLFTINSIVYSPDGHYFATASRDKTIKIWNAENFELLKVIDKEKFDGHSNSVNKLIWTSHENLLLSCSDDRTVMVWSIRIR